MRIATSLLIFLIAVIPLTVNATSALPRKGYKIVPDYQALGSIQKDVGEVATFKGVIKKVKPWENPEKDDQLKLSELDLQFYYPDLTQEVTDQVSVTLSPNKKSVFYEFITAPIAQGYENKFIVKVGKSSPKIRGLEVSLAKVNRTIIVLSNKIQELEDLQNPRPGTEKVIKSLEHSLNKLLSIAVATQAKITYETESFAEYQQPIMIGNQLVTEAFMMSKYDGFKLLVKASKGIFVQGEEGTLTYRVINEAHRPYSLLFDDDHFLNELFGANTDYLLKLEKNGVLIGEIGPQKIPMATQINDEIVIASNSIDAMDIYSMELTKIKKFLFIFNIKTRVGGVGLGVFNLEDDVAPAWDMASVLPQEDDGLYSQLPTISANLSDGLGRLNESSLNIAITGTQDDGQLIARMLNVSSTSTDEFRSAALTVVNETLPDGNYIITYQGKDEAGNNATPLNLTKNFILDTKPPVINLDQFGGIISAQATFRISGNINDLSQTTTTYFLNDLQVGQFSEKEFEFDVNLIEGINSIRIVSVDELGNQSQPVILSNIILDTVAPVIGTTNLGSIFTNNPSYNLAYTITDQTEVVSEVYLNGAKVFTSTNKNVQTSLALVEGLNLLQILAVDQAQNSSTLTISNIFLDTIAPIINVAQQDNQLLNNSSFTVNISVEELNEIEGEIFLNDNLVMSFNQKNTTGQLLLREGMNTIRFTARDQANNQAIEKVLSNIILDTTPPVLGNLIPSNNALIEDQLFLVSGTSNEILQSVLINGQTANISADKLTFSLLFDQINAPNGLITIIARDMANNSSTQSLQVEYNTGDREGPQIAFFPIGGNVESFDSDITLNFTDAGQVDFSKMLIKRNNILVPMSNIEILYLTNQVILNFNSAFPLETSFINVITVTIADTDGNFSQASTLFSVGTIEDPDEGGPIINFQPGGGTLASLTTPVDIAFADRSGVNFSSILVTINGEEIPASRLLYFEEINKVSILFDENFKFLDDFFNLIEVSVEDIFGNASIARVAFDTKNQIVETIQSPIAEGAYGNGGHHNCLVLMGGSIKCFGQGTNGVLGQGNTLTIGDNETPSSISAISFSDPIEKIFSAFTHNCTLDVNKKLRCWGGNSSWQLGLGHSNTIGDNEDISILPPMEFGMDILDVALGAGHSCVLLQDGNVKCWGSATFGVLGQGNAINYGDNELANAVPAINLGEKAISISSRNRHTCAILESKKVICWGLNSSGQLGRGHTNIIGDNETPAGGALTLLGPAKQLTVGGSFTCALLESGDIQCWGANDRGQLGHGSTRVFGDNEHPNTAGFVQLPKKAIQVTAGNEHTCAILEDNTLYCWGYNGNHQLGLGAIGQSIVGDNELPTAFGPVNVGLPVVSVSGGLWHTCAVTSIGSIRCWGSNSSGALGYGISTIIGDNETPAQVGDVPFGGTIQLPTSEDGGQDNSFFAYFNLLPEFGPVPLNVILDYSQSRAGVGSQFAIQRIDWGDGIIENVTGFNANHTYANSDVYYVSLFLSNTEGQQATFTRPLTVGMEEISRPVAKLIVSETIGAAPLTITLDASGSFHALGKEIIQYQWFTGNGNVVTTTTPTLQVTYDDSGVFAPQVLVKDEDNQEDISLPVIVTVNSGNQRPVANFECSGFELEFNCNSDESFDFDGTIVKKTWMTDTGIVHIGDTFQPNFPANVANANITLLVEDNGGLVGSTTKSFKIDNTAPIIATSIENKSVNTLSISFSVSITEPNLQNLTVFQNTTLVHSSSATFTTISRNLILGANNFKITATDKAGNTSEKTLTIIRDTTLPTLIAINPEGGSQVLPGAFLIQGEANEPLSAVTFGGTPLAVSGAHFSGVYTPPNNTLGSFTSQLRMTDVAGNTRQQNISYTRVDKLILPAMIAIFPQEDGKLKVAGSEGSTRPGVSIEIDGGFFNNETVTSNSNGNFEAILSFFNSVEVIATDTSTGETESVIIPNGIDTTLSGVIKDTFDTPLQLVKVTIASSGEEVFTDHNGVFTFSNPAKGQQELIIDGTQIPEAFIGTTKKFSRLNFFVDVKNDRRNVLEKIIYLAPLLLDGSETPVSFTSSAVVTSEHAPGVRLNIPAFSVNIPSGATSTVNILKLSKEKTTVLPPRFADPNEVYAFEPSGATFRVPADLTLPNVNEFPAGTQMMILSKNSANGRWEIDGVADVTPDGQSIQTRPGMGITHFSEIYASPLGPLVKSIGAQDVPGADTFNGAMSTSIKMPSFKRLGQDISPTLIYKSNWASPSIIVSNLFDIPRYEVTRERIQTTDKYDYIITEKIEETTWVVPSSIKATFKTLEVNQTTHFHGVPNRSVVSYGIDLSNFDSGIYPYISNYEIVLSQMIIRTREIEAKTVDEFVTFANGERTINKIERYDGSRLIDILYPKDLRAPFIVQNKIDSEFGRGWKMAGVQEILNPTGSRLVVEEADGSLATYVPNNIIETLHTNSEPFYAPDLKNWPLVVYRDGQHNVFELDLLNENSVPIHLTQIEPFEAIVPVLMTSETTFSGTSTKDRECLVNRWSAKYEPDVNHFYRLPNGKILFGDRHYLGLIENHSANVIDGHNDDVLPTEGIKGTQAAVNGSFSPILFNLLQTNPNFNLSYKPVYCQSSRFSCEYIDYFYNQKSHFSAITDNCLDEIQDVNPSVQFIQGKTPAKISWHGSTIPRYDFLNAVQFFYQQTNGIDPAFDRSSYVVKDGKRFRLFDPQTELSSDYLISNTVNFTDPGVAITSDGSGFYYTVQGQTLYRIDANGNYSVLNRGTPQLSDQTSVDNLFMTNPSDLIWDKNSDYLYIADTGNNRVLRVDLATNSVQTIAGNTDCTVGNDIGDGKSAILASICSPTKLGFDDAGNLLVFDSGHHKIRRVRLDNGVSGQGTEFIATTNDLSKIEKTASNEFVRTYRNGKKVFFNNQGRQTKISDRQGLETNYVYEDNKLTEVTYPTGDSLLLNYSGNRLESIQDPTGRVTTFQYNGNLLEEVVYPDGTFQDFTYQNGLVVSQSDTLGNFTNYQYNQYNRLIQATSPEGRIRQLSDSGSKTAGNDTSEVQTKTLAGYGDSAENVSDEQIDGNGNVSTFIKDEGGYVTKVKNASGEITTYDRDEQGRLLKITRPNGTFKQYTYDALTNDLLSEYDSDADAMTSKLYNEFGQPILFQTDDTEITYSYDPSTGHLVNAVSSTGKTVQNTYNGMGLLDSTTNNINQTLRYEHDINGNVIKKIFPDNTFIEYNRNSIGLVTEIKNANNQIKSLSYDQHNRLILVISPNFESMSYRYTARGELSEIIDHEGNKTQFFYDRDGLLTSSIDPDGRTRFHEYDGNSNLTKFTDEANLVVNLEYDEQNRLARKIFADNTVEQFYDESGNISILRDNKSEVEFDYSIDGQVLSAASRGRGAHADLPEYLISYEYDFNGNRTKMTSPVGATNYGFDDQNRLISQVTPDQKLFEWSYDINDRLQSVSSPVYSTTINRDVVDFPTQINHSTTQGHISLFDYTRDPIGNRLSKTTDTGNYSYQYENNNQLTIASTDDFTGDYQNESFNYDSLGNRQADQLQNYTYNEEKTLLLEDSRYSYVYDAYGNVIHKQSKLQGVPSVGYWYNSQRELVEVKHFDGMTLLKEIRYTYDVLGRRVKRQVIDHQNSLNNRLTKFAFDGDRPIIEYDQNNSVVAVNDFSPLSSQDILARKLGSETYYYLTDSIGSVTDLVNSQGEIVERYRYSSFGVGIKSVDYENKEIPISQQIDNPFKYIAREWDSDAGLLYLRARYYDPTIGRFISQDPHPGVMTNHLTVANKYIYSSNNPINLSDPNGLFGKFFKKLWNSTKKRKKRIIGLTIATIVGGPLGQLAYINLSGEFHENDIAAINVGVSIAAGVATGGVAGFAIAGGGIGGANARLNNENILEGIVVGAAVGAALGAAGTLAPFKYLAATVLGLSALDASLSRGNFLENFTDNTQEELGANSGSPLNFLELGLGLQIPKIWLITVAPFYVLYRIDSKSCSEEATDFAREHLCMSE